MPPTCPNRRSPLGNRWIARLPKREQIRVGPVDSEEVAERLQADGIGLYAADRLGAVARMSLPALCRQLARQPDLMESDWCTDTLVRRMILLGGWHRDHDGDKQILEQVTGRSYEELTGRLYDIVGDPPLVLTGPRWHTASPSDAWDQISHRVTHEELDAFRDRSAAGAGLTGPLPVDGRRPRTPGAVAGRSCQPL